MFGGRLAMAPFSSLVITQREVSSESSTLLSEQLSEDGSSNVSSTFTTSAEEEEEEEEEFIMWLRPELRCSRQALKQ